MDILDIFSLYDEFIDEEAMIDKKQIFKSKLVESKCTGIFLESRKRILKSGNTCYC